MKLSNVFIVIIVIFLLSLFGTFFFMLSESFNASMNYTEVIIKGYASNTTAYENYMSIEFNDNKSQIYDVFYPKSADFTVNSQLIVVLRKYDYDGFFITPDEHWVIDKIVKVPDEEG